MIEPKKYNSTVDKELLYLKLNFHLVTIQHFPLQLFAPEVLHEEVPLLFLSLYLSGPIDQTASGRLSLALVRVTDPRVMGSCLF